MTVPRGDIDMLIAEAVAHADLRCPRLPAHPDGETVAIEARVWAQRTGLSAAAEGGVVDRRRPVGPVAEAMRDAPIGALRIAGLYATWLEVLNERALVVGWDLGYAASLVTILREGYTTGADALHFALTDLYERITAGGGAAVLPDLADALERYCAAARRDRDLMSAELPPSLPEFLDNRVDRTPVPMFTALHRLDPALGALGGPPAEGIAPLTELAGLLTAVDEDLTGYRQAVEAGTRLTLIPVLMREYGHSVPTAFQSGMVLFGAWKTQLDHGVRAVSALPDVSSATRRQAQAAVDWVGALHRYHAAQARTTLAVPLG
ncbi:terpene synthase family protein [Yinghuangia seranimata]|uniref:terpene synthase family protein n=1 Tax=Yinghuangia seranimata TaxID=408067 RepID=UPI00248C8DBF|nr:terpene synthase family protein [Yinghuangia seranimata]MDI2127220.1 terpene synthase family protein [Yinghuangia seranimata]